MISVVFQYWKQVLVVLIIGALALCVVYYRERTQSLEHTVAGLMIDVDELTESNLHKDNAISALQVQAEANAQSCVVYSDDVKEKEVIIKRIKTKCVDKKEAIDEESSRDLIRYYNGHVVGVQ